MKQTLLKAQGLKTLLLSALFIIFGGSFSQVWGEEESVTFSEQNYSNQQAIESYRGSNFTISFDKGTNNSNAPKYFTTGKAIRAYGGNTFTVSSSNTITNVVITFGSGDGTNAITANCGTYESGTWTGSATEITFTVGGDSGHRRLAGIAVTYTTGGGSTAASTTTKIVDDELTNTDISQGTAAGNLTATVEAGNDAIQGATVTWSGNNDAVATINATTGAVTLVAPGFVTFTANYAGEDGTYKASSATYNLSVSNSAPAVLPFSWAGGTSGELLLQADIIGNSLNDYADANAPYRVQFNADGDFIQIHTASQPGQVTIGVKMIGGANTSIIKVQESADGETFTDVEGLTISGSQNSTHSLATTKAFKSDSRYVQLYFNKGTGSNIGVGPISIVSPAASIVPAETAFEFSGAEHAGETITLTANNASVSSVIFCDEDGAALSAEYIPTWITASVNNNVISYSLQANTGTERTAYLKVQGTSSLDQTAVYSDLITITQLAATSYTITFGSATNSEFYVYDDSNGSALSNGASVLSGTTIYISAVAATGYGALEVSVVDDEDNPIKVTAPASEGDMYSFIISSNVTITTSASPLIAYNLTTSITPGKRYIIVNKNTNGTAQAMTTQNDNNRTSKEVTIENRSIRETEGELCELVVYGPDARGFYTLYDATSGDGGYLYAASSSNNYLKTQETLNANGKWAITFDDENDAEAAVITGQGEYTRNIIRSNGNIFSCYASGQKPIYLYEKAGAEAVATTTSVKLNGSGYATYSYTSALDFTDNASADYSAWQITSIEGDVITFSQLTGSVAAGKGLLLKGTAGATANLNILPVGGATLSTNKLEGITEATTITADQYYGLSGQSFVPVSAGTVPAGKALLPASEVPAQAGVNAFTFVFEGADGVRTVQQVSAAEAEAIFDISGRRLQQMQRGLNIVGGKKVIRKN